MTQSRKSGSNKKIRTKKDKCGYYIFEDIKYRQNPIQNIQPIA